MWLACVAVRAARSTRATTRSPSCSSPLVGLHDERLVVADAHDVDDARRAVAALALDGADVGDLAAAGRVERRLGELDEHARRRRPPPPCTAPTVVCCSSVS